MISYTSFEKHLGQEENEEIIDILPTEDIEKTRGKSIIFYDPAIKEFKVKLAWASFSEQNHEKPSIKPLNDNTMGQLPNILRKIKKTDKIYFIFQHQETISDFRDLLKELYDTKINKPMPRNIFLTKLGINSSILDKAA